MIEGDQLPIQGWIFGVVQRSRRATSCAAWRLWPREWLTGSIAQPRSIPKVNELKPYPNFLWLGYIVFAHNPLPAPYKSFRNGKDVGLSRFNWYILRLQWRRN